ncbi:MAG TPA: sigma-54 dependent transcriptional regulator [Bacteroidales bacterium]|nr:sigma-54 dependent transcriptional regulator [Bacteroidales bacterium]HSA43066.1 sigma-54 dependent transcriptional regulator [Bacteroidales bacterium]
MDTLPIKQRFGIIGNSPLLDRAIHIAWQVAATDITVLITGESGTGKEFFPKIIHQMSPRKHGPFIAVNCGAIPEGTIDSELFGHEKGSFTGAHEARKGYFEVVNTGTIFLDEVAELPLSTQVRLLRILESGEFIRVGSSKVQKTDVRVVAATNVDMMDAIDNGKFRQDLYYRLSTVPIFIPPLRERKEDILLLFRKFAADFAENYRMPAITLNEDARQMLMNYRWPGNIRQLKNITEQISIIEKNREISPETLMKYLPEIRNKELPVLWKKEETAADFSEREILYKVLFDMKKDIFDLKKLVMEIMDQGFTAENLPKDLSHSYHKLFSDVEEPAGNNPTIQIHQPYQTVQEELQDPEVFEESLSLSEREKELIVKALEKYKGKRKFAARDLGISERTLYRKIKEYGIHD